MPASTYDRKGLRQFYIQIEQSSLIPDGRRSLAADRLEFSELPESLSLSKSATYTDETIPGRSEPIKVYNSSSPTRIGFKAALYAQGQLLERGTSIAVAAAALGLTGRFVSPTRPFLGIAGNAVTQIANLAESNPNGEETITVLWQEVHQKLAWLEALTYPQYDALGRAFPPPVVRIHYGANLERRGVITSIDFEYKGPWEINTLLVYGADVTLAFEEVNTRPRGYLDVRNREPVETQKGSRANTFDRVKRNSIDFARTTFGL